MSASLPASSVPILSCRPRSSASARAADRSASIGFMPKTTIPYLAWAATVCETSFGILLILGLWPRWVSLGSAILLAMFGTAMAISLGLKSPMDYSVYSASGAAVLLALDAFRQRCKTISQ